MTVENQGIYAYGNSEFTIELLPNDFDPLITIVKIMERNVLSDLERSREFVTTLHNLIKLDKEIDKLLNKLGYRKDK